MPTLSDDLLLEYKIEIIAESFHAAYEELAPRFNYKTREASSVAWKDVPTGNKELMRATVRALLTNDTIQVGSLARLKLQDLVEGRL